MKKTRRFYTILAMLGLVLYLGAFFGQVRLAALPLGDVEALDLVYPTTLGGLHAGSLGELERLAEAFSPGQDLVLVDASGYRYVIELVPAHSWFYLLVTCMSGLLFWAVATFVFAPRLHQPAVVYFFWCTFLYGWAIMIGGVYFPHPPVLITFLFNLGQSACLVALPLLFLHLTLHFPHPAPVLPRIRRKLHVLTGIAAAIVVWQVVVFQLYYLAPGPERARALKPADDAGGLFLVVLVTTGFVILARRSRKLEFTREKNQVKWLLWGFVVGVAPYVFLRTLPDLFGIAPPLGPIFDRLFELAIPLAFVSAVVFFRLLDIDLLIRRSLIYALLAAAFVLFNVVIGFATARWILPRWPGGVWPLLTGMGLVAGITFRPLRGGIGRWVERVFFKIRHDHDQALSRFRPAMNESLDYEELAGLLVPFLRERFGAGKTAVLLRGGGAARTVGGDLEPFRINGVLEEIERRPGGELLPLAARDVTSLPELESDDFPALLRREGYVLAQPLSSGGDLTGAVLLGPKETGWRYVEPDLQLLGNLARTTGEALGRIALLRRVTEEALERRRLDELNRLKSDFLSRVSHDLRTPLTSIAWSTQNLLDGVAGHLDPAQKEYLESVKTSATHLNRMVANLLEISRLELAQTSLELEPVDLEAVLTEAASTLHPLVEEKSVAFRFSSGDGTPLARADRGKMFEVAMNLLDNAVKYTAPGTEVEIRVGTHDAGRPGFSIRDHGPGIDPAAVQQLFQAFQQGEQSPHSSQHGFGLGLYITKTYVDLFDGTIEAKNHPEGGAEFVCTFPPSSSPERSGP
jgi:signal transduction histidine kinase